MMNLLECDIVANDVRLHVYRTGGERPSIIFVHGMSDNGLCYWPIAQQFAGKYAVVLYDSCNHGRSDAPERQTTLYDRAHDLATLIDALGLDKPILVGHSMGAATVMLFAGLYPHIPKGVVLEDPPTFEMMEGNNDPDNTSRLAWRASAALNKERPLDELVAMSYEDGATWDDAERMPWAQSKQQFHLNTFDEIPISAVSGNRTTSQITCPTLLLTGDIEMGALYPPTAAETFVAQLPQGEHVHISGAGHSIRRDQPERFTTAVTRFLDGLAVD